MERARQTLKWNQRSEFTKTIFVIGIVVVMTLGGYGLFTVSMGTPNPLVVVESDSMIPTLYRGHLLILQARAPELIQVGDIIVFNAIYHDKPIVHRIVEIENVTIEIENVTTSELHYYTLGDNNDLRDRGYRVHDDIIGVVVLAVPYIGQVTLFLHEPYGFAIVVILFLALLILPEFFMKDEEEEDADTEIDEQNTTEQETANA